ncbi:hypothetical protein HNY73_015798 [Argiope bruennichi]|uniref:Uncharacterized protein n=1 Tax=Argiope bruennichi TaxID=94029 RepID=A0A8T0EGY9_ARGBR|nr:hypothetical protein HNY73_015798 [Argiope bruennichi]
MSTLSNSSSDDLSSTDKNPFRGRRFARAFFSSCMGLPRNNAAYAANSDFEWDTVSERGGGSDEDFSIYNSDDVRYENRARIGSEADIQIRSLRVDTILDDELIKFWISQTDNE